MFRLSDYEVWSHKAETGIRDMNRMIIIKQTDTHSADLIREESWMFAAGGAKYDQLYSNGRVGYN